MLFPINCCVNGSGQEMRQMPVQIENALIVPNRERTYCSNNRCSRMGYRSRDLLREQSARVISAHHYIQNFEERIQNFEETWGFLCLAFLMETSKNGLTFNRGVQIFGSFTCTEVV